MNKKKHFLSILKKAEKKFGKSSKRLAAEGWQKDWQILISTILSAQNRDEVTIPSAEQLFKKYKTLQELAPANYQDVLNILRKVNYNRTKAKNIIETAKILIKDFNGKVPDDINTLLKLPGVGRKTANLVLIEAHNKESICVDTHVHRISNAFGFVRTKSPEQTEIELKKFVPKKYWARINRLFVLWGKQAHGRNREKLLRALKYKYL